MVRPRRVRDQDVGPLLELCLSSPTGPRTITLIPGSHLENVSGIARKRKTIREYGWSSEKPKFTTEKTVGTTSLIGLSTIAFQKARC